MNRPTKMMVEHLNLKLKYEGSCLQYVEGNKDCNLITYTLQINEKYIDNKYHANLNVTEEFENMVRDFFKKYNAEDIGYTNTVITIFAKVC